MATITVTNTNDTGAGSLRDAVAQANANADADTIVFSAALAGQTIALSTGELKLRNDVTIDGDVNGDNKADITISGSNLSRIFNIDTRGTDVDLLSLTLTNGSSSTGGAILTTDSITLDIMDSTIRNSQADAGGGIYINGFFGYTTSFTATNVAIYGNSATDRGGGVYADSEGTSTFINSTIANNTAGTVGGGINSWASNQLTLINSTVSGNTASSVGGIYHSNSGGSLTVQNSVVAANTGGDIGLFSSTTAFTATHSFFGTDVSSLLDSGTANTQNGGNPGLGPLADNGGTVKTMLPGFLSPLVDTGDSSLAPLGEAANGIPRIVGPAVDIGAAESVPEHLVVTISTDEDDGDYAPDDLSLREAIKLANSNADANTITFDASLAGQTLVLTNGELAIISDVTIDGDTDGDRKADVTVSGNDASRVFFITGASTDATVKSLTLSHGRTQMAGYFASTAGAAVLADQINSLNIQDTTISGSKGLFGGAIALNFVKLTTVSNVTLVGNSAYQGAGIFIQNSSYVPGEIVVSNSTITDNTAVGIGGAILATGNTRGTLTVSNSTIVGNHAYTTGGVASVIDNTNLNNSIVAGNSDLYSGGGADPDIFLGANLDHTIIGSASSLGLGTLGDHGGSVQTFNIVDGHSVLIDAGSNDLVPLTLTNDANGNPRINRGTVDIGAVEYQNTAPLIVTSALSVTENRSLAGTVDVNDAEGDTLTFSITGGADGGKFSIDASTGALSFLTPPDFENPTDAGHDNVYEVRVTVADPFGGSDEQKILVTVKNGNDRPVITSDGGKLRASVDVAENGTAVTKVQAFDEERSSITYAISGGDDKALFAIDATTGKVTFKSAPDFEAPQDKNHDNAYHITIRATDSDGAIDVQYLTVKVTDTDGVSITGTSAADTVNANKTVAGQPAPTGEEDHIRGLGGKDILNGLGGDDILEGGAAKDRLKGGLGHDSFVYRAVTDSSAATGIDVITGFVQGDDTIDLSAIDGGFHFLGETDFDGTAGALRQRTAGSDVFLEGDTDGNGVADLVILLKGAAGLVLTDGDLGL